MPDTLTAAQRSERMSRIRGRDTKPELIVRRLVHARGYRYRLHRRDLPGTPDLVFPKLRKAIFVHGCFWHRHRDPSCKLSRLPKSRLDFWEAKLNANEERDSRKIAALIEREWEVSVVWECETKNITSLEPKIMAFLIK